MLSTSSHRTAWMASCSLLILPNPVECGDCSCCRSGAGTGLYWETNVVWMDGMGGSLRILPQDSSIYVCSTVSLPVGPIDTHLHGLVSCTHTSVLAARKVISLAWQVPWGSHLPSACKHCLHGLCPSTLLPSNYEAQALHLYFWELNPRTCYLSMCQVGSD